MLKARRLGVCIGLLLVFLTEGPAFACMYAFHHQLLPLGTVSDDVVALEIVVFRYGDSEMTDVWWTGHAGLVRIAPLGLPDAAGTGARINSIPLGSPIKFNTRLFGYQATLLPIAALLAMTARSLEHFISVPPPTTVGCDDSLRCGDWSVLFGYLHAESPQAATTPFAWLVDILPEAFLAERQQAKGVDSIDAAKTRFLQDQRAAVDSLPSAGTRENGFRFLSLFRLTTIRSYEGSFGTIHVVGLRRGDFGDDSDPTLVTPPTPLPAPSGCEEIIGCLEPPDSLHHGEGFDLLVRIPRVNPRMGSSSVGGPIWF
jgi:hypothetical protein